MFKTKKSKFGTKIPIICVHLTFRSKETIAIFDISFFTFSNLKVSSKSKNLGVLGRIFKKLLIYLKPVSAIWSVFKISFRNKNASIWDQKLFI